MSQPNEEHLNWFKKYYGQLVGATIKQVIIGIDEEFGVLWPCFKVKLEDGREIEIQIQADEEGNGPGFISGISMPRSDSRQEKPQKLTEADNKPAYMASVADKLLEKHHSDVTTTKDGRKVATVKVNDKELIEIGQDPDSPDRYAIFLTDWTTEDPEPAFKLGNLDETTMVTKVTALIEGREGVRHDLMLEHAHQLLGPEGGEMWHSGGGIWLVAISGSGKAIHTGPDELGAATFGLETIDEKSGEVLHRREGMTSGELLEEWKEQVSEHIN